MISIIIPLYNGEKTIIQTLASLEKQSFQDFEVIIVNDGSTDNSEDIVTNFVKKCAGERSYSVFKQENKGAPAARNLGFHKAQGEFVLFCDADAVFKPNALEIMLAKLQAYPEVSYVYSSFMWGKKLFKLKEFNSEHLKQAPYIHTMSLLRRSDFPQSGWDESINKFQDWDLWLTMLAEGKVGKWIPEVLFMVKPGGVISFWLPAFAYKLFPFLKIVKKYNEALMVIKKKHNLL